MLGEQRAREEAERANRIKDEFLAVLSYELRSPLNPILGWAKLLQSEAMPKAIALTAYAGEVDQQQALAAGFQKHIAKPVEPDELVRAVARLLEHP